MASSSQPRLRLSRRGLSLTCTEGEVEVEQDISSLNTNLLAQLNVDLISKTDISIASLDDLLGHSVDRHPHLGLPVGHVDLDHFEDGHSLFLLLFLIDKSERFAGSKKNKD